MNLEMILSFLFIVVGIFLVFALLGLLFKIAVFAFENPFLILFLLIGSILLVAYAK